MTVQFSWFSARTGTRVITGTLVTNPSQWQHKCTLVHHAINKAPWRALGSPQVDVLDVTHPQQAPELQGFDLVPGHEQPVHSAEPLQHGGDVRERVEGEPETTELHQIPQLIRQRAQVIPIQRESLQTWREKNTSKTLSSETSVCNSYKAFTNLHRVYASFNTDSKKILYKCSCSRILQDLATCFDVYKNKRWTLNISTTSIYLFYLFYFSHFFPGIFISVY